MTNRLKKMIQKKISQKKAVLYYESFSQSGEDLIVKFIFDNYLKIHQPTYIDLGAYDPFHFSNTELLYRNGSKGINIEPNPNQFKNFLKYRKRDINLNIGVSDKRDLLEYYVMSVSTMNTFSSEEVEKLQNESSIKLIKSIKVQVDTLPEILNKYWNGAFPDFLSIDAEGLELPIMGMIDFESNYPKVICIETLTYSENNNEEKDLDIIKYLKDKGYILYADTYINSIFVKDNLWNNR